MAKYIIEIEDGATGVRFKAGALKEPDGSIPNPAKTPAGRMFGYLTQCAEAYLETLHMDIPQALAYLKAKSNKPATH